MLNGQSLSNINGGEIAGAALGGATGGALGQSLEDLAIDAGMKGPLTDWGNDIIGGNLGLVGSMLGREFGESEGSGGGSESGSNDSGSGGWWGGRCSMTARKC